MPTKITKAATRPPARKRLAFTLQLASKAARIPASRKLKSWAREALNGNARVTVRIVGAREGRALNCRFRGRDCATNVLTFTYSDEPVVRGDIALCAPVIEREARTQAKKLDAHYAHLIVHGMLHLQGHDHRAKREAQAMEAHEVAILKRLGYDNPYLPGPT